MNSPTHTASGNQALPTGFALEGYRIERRLSMGGFSMVYLAHDEAGTPVAIKEYLPARLAHRVDERSVSVVAEADRPAFNHGLKAFFEEGRILAHIDHPNVVKVLNFFRANQTAYMVMRYETGHSLQEIIRKVQERGEPIKEEFLRNLFVPLLSGLREVHKQKLLHLDIKPANIYLRNSGQPVLIDFGASRHGLGGDGQAHGAVYTPGFAAPEQEHAGQALGPWTDIYSIGATIYTCLAGRPPVAAKVRLDHDALESAQRRWFKAYSPQLLELVDWCMRLNIDERPQSVFALQKVLQGELLDLVDPHWFETPQ
jgi:serine/threonine protein kinase